LRRGTPTKESAEIDFFAVSRAVLGPVFNRPTRSWCRIAVHFLATSTFKQTPPAGRTPCTPGWCRWD